MQTAILAIADLFIVKHALTSWPRKSTHALLAVLLIVQFSFLLAATVVGDVSYFFNVGVAVMKKAFHLRDIFLRIRMD